MAESMRAKAAREVQEKQESEFWVNPGEKEFTVKGSVVRYKELPWAEVIKAAEDLPKAETPAQFTDALTALLMRTVVSIDGQPVTAHLLGAIKPAAIIEVFQGVGLGHLYGGDPNLA